MRPRILDLYAGAGGAAVGYHRAGFDVVGVDNRPQPYPFEFVQADALTYLRYLEAGLPTGGSLAAIHASPPCQRYSTATKRNGTELGHPDLIGPTRELLEQTGLPYVIENVVGAPLIDPVLICGTERGLRAEVAEQQYRLRRHRLFETNWPLTTPGCGCTPESSLGVPVMDVSGGGPTKKPRTDGGGGRPYKGTADQARRIMGIDWMTKAELNEAVPPAYTELIGAQLLAHINRPVAAAVAGGGRQ